ncbi:MAG: hypothetical protein RSE23_01895 [Clostridia bacterium]
MKQRDLDCTTCIHRATCGRYQPGMYCTSYASKEPPPRMPKDDPNLQWNLDKPWEDV